MPGSGTDEEFLHEATRRVHAALSAAPGRTPHYAEASAWVDWDVDTASGWVGDYYDHGNWTAGFWAGMLLELGSLGGPADQGLAEAVADRVRGRAGDTGTHDLGFLFQPSACLLSGIDRDERWRAAGLRAAETLLARRRPGGYLQAFGELDDPQSFGTSTIDTMMNLPLLWWAAEQTGREDFRRAAVDHADTTARGILREDGSTYHLVRYDEAGAVVRQGTYQGSADDSCWTRGQAWAVHGYITCALATGLPRFAERARATLDFYWDHHDPARLPPYDLVIDSQYRDSAAAAIVASGLAEAARAPELSALLDAQRKLPILLDTLEREALFRDEIGLLAHSAYSVPHKLGVDAPVPYGDYYFLRALRLREDQRGRSAA